MKNNINFFVFFFTVQLLISCDSIIKKEVTYGTITKCKICETELSKSIFTRKVSFFEEKDWKVVVIEIICDRCNNEIINFEINYFCGRCGIQYSKKKYSGTRKYAPEKYNRDGYCSTKCKALAKGEKLINDGYDHLKEKLKDGIH